MYMFIESNRFYTFYLVNFIIQTYDLHTNDLIEIYDV